MEVVTRYYYRGSFVASIINGIIGIIEFLLLVRFVLELLGANASSQFVDWVYNVSGAFMSLFTGVFPNFDFGGFMVDTAAIVAMIGYAILGWLLMALLSFIFDAARSI